VIILKEILGAEFIRYNIQAVFALLLR